MQIIKINHPCRKNRKHWKIYRATMAGSPLDQRTWNPGYFTSHFLVFQKKVVAMFQGIPSQGFNRKRPWKISRNPMKTPDFVFLSGTTIFQGFFSLLGLLQGRGPDTPSSKPYKTSIICQFTLFLGSLRGWGKGGYAIHPPRQPPHSPTPQTPSNTRVGGSCNSFTSCVRFSTDIFKASTSGDPLLSQQNETTKTTRAGISRCDVTDPQVLCFKEISQLILVSSLQWIFYRIDELNIYKCI